MTVDELRDQLLGIPGSTQLVVKELFEFGHVEYKPVVVEQTRIKDAEGVIVSVLAFTTD